MRILVRGLGAASVLLVTGGALIGCTGAPSTVSSPPVASPSPTPSPIFTSDADALAAATKVYTEYLQSSDEIGHDGGADPDRIRKYASESVVQAKRAQAQKLVEANARSYGETRLTNASLQSVRQIGQSVSVSIYVCQDVSGVDVRDETGRSLISASRGDLIAYVVGFENAPSGQLIVTSNRFWTGGGVCE